MINLQFYFTDSITGFLVSTSFLYLIINIFSCCVSILFLFYKQFLVYIIYPQLILLHITFK